VTLTPNPASEMGTSVGEVRDGPKLRGAAPRSDPGGGIDMSSVIARMGGKSIGFAAFGEAGGAYLAEL